MAEEKYFFATKDGFKKAEEEYKLLEESICFKKKEAEKLNKTHDASAAFFRVIRKDG